MESTIIQSAAGGAAGRTLAVEHASALAYDRFGASGPNVLLLHGIPGSRSTFAEVGERLGKTCRVFVRDLLGFGDSPDAPAHYHAAEHADVVIQLPAELAGVAARGVAGVAGAVAVGARAPGSTADLRAERPRAKVVELRTADQRTG